MGEIKDPNRFLAEAASLILGDVTADQAHRVLTCLEKREEEPRQYGEEISISESFISMRLNFELGSLDADTAKQVELLMRHQGQEFMRRLRHWLPIYNHNRDHTTASLCIQAPKP